MMCVCVCARHGHVQCVGVQEKVKTKHNHPTHSNILTCRMHVHVLW